MKLNYGFVLFFIAFFGIQTLNAAEHEENSSRYWVQGLSVARSGHIDSAFKYLEKSYSKGLPDDSLYYLWAEIYLYKGVLDTALALNLSIKPLPGSTMSKRVTEQRFLIYSMLGWKKEATALVDSTGSDHTTSRLRYFLPECTVYLSGGGYTEHNYTDREYPYPRAVDSLETLNNGNSIATVRLGWNIPVGRTQKLQIGTKARYSSSRFSYALQSVNSNDSGNTSLGVFLRYFLFEKKLSLHYTFSRKNDYRNTKTYVHTSVASYMFITDNFLGSIEGCYQYEAPVDEHYYYLMTWWSRLYGVKHEVSFDLFLSGFSVNQYTYTANGLIYFNEGMFYFDPLLQNPFLATSARTMLDTVYANTLVLGYWNINPHVRYEYLLNKRFSFGVGTAYTLTWYRGKNRWADYRYASINSIPPNNVTTDDLLAFNVGDRQYYWVDSLTTFRSNTGGIDTTLPVFFFSRQRIDQTFSLNLFVKTSFGLFGDMVVDVAARRNFSTLMDSAPIDIQKWYGEVTLSWFFRFRPGRKK